MPFPSRESNGAPISSSRFAFFTQWKAGSQWITDVLSDFRILERVPHVRFKRAFDVGYELTTFVREDAGVFVAPIFDGSYSLWKALRKEGDLAIRVGRDPRDTVVSYVYSLAYSHVTEPFISLVRAPLLTLDDRQRLMMAVALLITNAAALRSWGTPDRSSGCYITTYERVVDDEEREFAAMFKFLGWPIPDDVLREVVAAHSFTVRSGGRERGEADPFSHYRQGLAGDWRNHFDRDLARHFEETFPHLLVDLGYEETDAWWESVPVTVPYTASEGGAGALSEVMARALQERDERWKRHDLAMSERCTMLEQEIDSLRLICEERLQTINALDAEAQILVEQLNEGGANATSGGDHRIENDIVDGLATALGPGWYEAEFEDGVPFRWSRKDATIHVALVREVRHTLTLELEPGPGVRLEPFMLAVALADGTPLARILVNGRERVSFELPREAPRVFSIVLRAEEGGTTTADDERVLDFRVFDVKLETTDDVFPMWAQPAAGFYEPERDDDLLFRWIAGDATIVLSNTRGKRLSFDAESGPGFASQPFTLIVRAADGSEVASALVGTRVTVDVPIDRSDRFDALTLHADGGGRTVPGDDRVMNFRVFARELE